MAWVTRTTAFAWTVHEGRLLAVRHVRLGAEAWEVPGGHAQDGESLEETAARETLEETGVPVRVDRLMATCVHEWAERRQRWLVTFFNATPVHPVEPHAGDDGIVRAAWIDLDALTPASTSAFLHPLLDLASDPAPAAPLMFTTEHRRDSCGTWRPYVVRSG